MKTTIQRWGNSQGIRLPKNVLEAVRWNSGETLDITIQDGQIILKRAEPAVDIRELFAGYSGDYRPQEIDWGSAKGSEVW